MFFDDLAQTVFLGILFGIFLEFNGDPVPRSLYSAGSMENVSPPVENQLVVSASGRKSGM